MSSASDGDRGASSVRNFLSQLCVFSFLSLSIFFKFLVNYATSRVSRTYSPIHAAARATRISARRASSPTVSPASFALSATFSSRNSSAKLIKKGSKRRNFPLWGRGISVLLFLRNEETEGKTKGILEETRGGGNEKEEAKRQMHGEVIYSLRKSKVRECWRKMLAILREATAERGKFVNLSGNGSGGGLAGPRSALKAVLHFHGIMSTAAASLREEALRRRGCCGEVCAECLAGILGIPGWQFPVILSVFLAVASPRYRADSWMLPRVIGRERVRRRCLILP